MNVRATMETLFAGSGLPRKPQETGWRLIRRRRRPFLLLPPDWRKARVGLRLYSAQRFHAKMWRALLPFLLRTPAAGLLERIDFQVGASSDFMEFMAQQAGVPARQVLPVAAKLSDVGVRSRVVLLLCDETGRPARVIKAGLNEEGKAATNREADFLAQLPSRTIGGIRMTGRLNTPDVAAFATDYFPGASPEDDAGMEHLFHAWLNPGPPVPLESLPVWHELAAAMTQAAPEDWQILQAALAEKTVRTTLYHGDFTPWNIRAINARNLQAFDWERGSLQGVPGWDWFHFTVQTAILVRRYSPQRVAAEIEQMIHSERFKKYAAAAGLENFAQPLMLAYLLHQRWVVQPQEGRRTLIQVFHLLSAHWRWKPLPTRAPVPAGGLLATARRQLAAAASEWSNLFWEPRLNSNVPVSFFAPLKAARPYALGAGALFAAVFVTQYVSTRHMTFLLFYAAICAMVTWKLDRRWGFLAAGLGALAGPLALALKDSAFRLPEVMIWNTIMRLVTLNICVLFVARIRHQENFFKRRPNVPSLSVPLKEAWAVALTMGLALAVAVVLDGVSGPNITVLPLYLLPCMMLTLALGLRWGIAAALVAAFVGVLIQSLANEHYGLDVFIWNLFMRSAVCGLVLVLLDHLRKENVLFTQLDTGVVSNSEPLRHGNPAAHAERAR